MCQPFFGTEIESQKLLPAACQFLLDSPILSFPDCPFQKLTSTPSILQGPIPPMVLLFGMAIWMNRGKLLGLISLEGVPGWMESSQLVKQLAINAIKSMLFSIVSQ